LRNHQAGFRAAGARLVLVGMGTVEEASAFRAELAIEFPLLVDTERTSYAAAGLKRGSFMDVMGPGAWARGALLLIRGRGIRRVRQNPAQMGGALVVGAGGRVLYLHRGATSADLASPSDLLEALAQP
jgi:peroxiredoxin